MGFVRLLASCTEVSPLISIIVPVYNCEPYLEQCLRSLLDQSWADFEVLLINDGSQDRSGAICDEFAAIDVRIRVTHTPNGGVSAARNLALEQAQGEYVTFVDADDYVAPDFLERMVSHMASADLVACAYDRVRPNEAQPFVLGPSGPLELCLLYEHTLCTLLIGGGCCNKMFRLAPIRELGLRFDPRIAVGEDMLFLVQYYRRCRSAWYVGEVLYHYRFNESSVTESGFARKVVNERTASILLAVDAMARYIDPSVRFERDSMAYRRARSSLRLFFLMVMSRTSNPALMADVQRNIRLGLKAYLSSGHAHLIEKLAAACMAISIRLTYAMGVAISGIVGRQLASLRD